MPHTVLIDLRALCHLILTVTLDSQYYHYFYFTEEETEVQSGEATCPKPSN